MEERVYVYFDDESVDEAQMMGTLTATHLRGKEVFSFEYEDGWLQKTARCFDPDLLLFKGRQYVPEGKANFGLFLDSTPDRWGRVLMERRESIRAREEKRPVRTLFETDYLLGVFDGNRMGAMRFKTNPEGDFLDNDDELATPPLTSLRELENAALNIEEEDDVKASRWVKMLVSPGSSLGGARPKANVLGQDGHLWIAKFPSRKDRRDVGAWEATCMELARMSGIAVSPFSLEKFGSDHHTFLTRRFDRTEAGKRRHFTSAMTVLGYSDGEESEGASYLEIAEWIAGNCTDVKKNLKELFKRIAFNIAVSNCDDHLRNHGFLYTPKGWQLSPAYDLTPDPKGAGLKLNIDENDNSLDFDLLLSTARYYGITDAEASAIIKFVLDSVSRWPVIATRFGIPKSEQAIMEPAFSH